MRLFPLAVLAVLALVVALYAGPASAQDAVSPPAAGQTPAAKAQSGYDVLLGRWVRPDGGYVVTIKGVDASGNLDAFYANPRLLPFAKAEAMRKGKTMHIFLELRAAGYNGSTYTLTYNPEKDILEGIYYQAVAQQQFDVFFVRAK